jgi:hypothetical protein
VRRVKEKEAELKEAERELHNRFDKLKASVADEKRTVEEQRRALDEEIAEFQVASIPFSKTVDILKKKIHNNEVM